MGVENLLTWYQKKIGAYDKQQWETTVEQRILHGLKNSQLKTGKPKTDFIDLDLVRGSSFTKAKPKHGFFTVLRLSVLRIIFLPLYSVWWVKQTSGRIFLTLFLLYLLQLFNIAIYSYHSQELNIPLSEFAVPMLMIWTLSFVHSQIVATNPELEHESYAEKLKKHFRLRMLLARRKYKIDERAMRRTRKYRSPTGKNVLFAESHVCKSKPEDKRPGKLSGVWRHRKRSGADDDGFESLNGNGSSPSDNCDLDKPPKSILRSRPSKELMSESSGSSRCNEWMHERNRRQSAPDIQCISGSAAPPCDLDSDGSPAAPKPPKPTHAPGSTKQRPESACDTDEEGECEAMPLPETVASGAQIEANTSGNEWMTMGVTTNSDDCAYASEMTESDEPYDLDATPYSLMNPFSDPSNRMSCTIWDGQEYRKADLSVVEISSVIITRVESMRKNIDCFYMGIFITSIISSLPILCRFCDRVVDSSIEEELQVTVPQISHLVIRKFLDSPSEILAAFLGESYWERVIMLSAAIQRFVLGFFLFFLLAIAERTFKQRFLYAKLFSHLTSTRRARKSDLPHFRLNKVGNIITWLSVRTYLKKRGPQRSVEVIVSAAFIATLLLLFILCMELLKDTFVLNSHYNLEVLIWSLGLGLVILRFMILGVKINKKYRNPSVLITEQINLYLQIEQKPNKKDELMAANSVLKLAADLLKELESQFKIMGISVNPLLYNITKVVILSALSGVLSEILGFKLKLHKIKIK